MSAPRVANARGGGAPDLGRWLDGWLDAHADELVAIRRHIHAHPELSWEEHATTEHVAERLSVAGLTPYVLSAGTGLVCDVAIAGGGVDGSGGGSGPVVVLRADLDALPMDDEKDVPYRSQVPGVSHSCGHDVHTAVVLGAGLALAELAGRSTSGTLAAGTVRLVFQPAEEHVPGGAMAVIEEGWLDGAVAAVGLHCEPRLDAGCVGLRVGPITSAADMVDLELSGPGGHTARPEQTVDLVRVAAEVALRLPEEVVADPAGAGLRVVFGALQAGRAGNVIPSHATLAGTLRTADADAWLRAPEVLAGAVDRVVGPTGAQVILHHTRGIPPAVNARPVVEALRRAVGAVVGPDAVAESPQSAGGDDFAWFAQQVDACYARLGVRVPGTADAPLDLHAGHFDVDERAIGVGVRTLVASALDLLSGAF